MASKGKRFQRPIGERRYRKLFLVATEGKKTEPQYFAHLDRRLLPVVKIQPLKGKSDGAPNRVLARMKKTLKNENFRKGDEAWLVVDKDTWTDDQLQELHQWSRHDDNYGFALSNPKFEYWLLLHFEDGTGIANARQCDERLERYLPHYDKGVDADLTTLEKVEKAIRHAERRDKPPCADWPRKTGTTVYRLVKNILT